jgi:hypothetical protein
MQAPAWFLLSRAGHSKDDHLIDLVVLDICYPITHGWM